MVGKHAASQTSPVEALGKNATSPPTPRELFRALFSSFAANRTQCIIEKSAPWAKGNNQKAAAVAKLLGILRPDVSPPQANLECSTNRP